jgi:hypothetical protein
MGGSGGELENRSSAKTRKIFYKNGISDYEKLGLSAYAQRNKR